METQRHALVKRDYLVPFVLVTSLFFLWGFAHAILDVLNKHFQDVMNISRAHSAWVQVIRICGRIPFIGIRTSAWNNFIEIIFHISIKTG